MIRTSHLSYVVGGRALIDDCSLEFPAASLSAVLGPNGAGKSTLMRLMAGDLRPSAGDISLGERPLSAWDLKSLAQCRAVVSQFNQVAFPFTCTEIVALGRAPHRRDETRDAHRSAVQDAMRRMDVLSLGARVFASLSGGEQQRVAIARALAQIEPLTQTRQPRYLLLDEPTASLDLAHQYRLMTLLRELADDGLTVVVVLHDINLALAYADRVAVLNYGSVAATGDMQGTLTAALVQEVFKVSASAVATATGRTLVFASHCSTGV